MLADPRYKEGVVRQSMVDHKLYITCRLGAKGPATDVTTARRCELQRLNHPQRA